jgi:hypothetical protein
MARGCRRGNRLRDSDSDVSKPLTARLRRGGSRSCWLDSQELGGLEPTNYEGPSDRVAHVRQLSALNKTDRASSKATPRHACSERTGTQHRVDGHVEFLARNAKVVAQRSMGRGEVGADCSYLTRTKQAGHCPDSPVFEKDVSCSSTQRCIADVFDPTQLIDISKRAEPELPRRRRALAATLRVTVASAQAVTDHCVHNQQTKVLGLRQKWQVFSGQSASVHKQGMAGATKYRGHLIHNPARNTHEVVLSMARELNSLNTVQIDGRKGRQGLHGRTFKGR